MDVTSAGKTEPIASILVCTRNRAQSLSRCLSSIMADQSDSPRDVCVVDNGSSDDTRAVVGRFIEGAKLPVSYIHEARPGHSVARNRGIASCRGEIVLFTDDDTEVESGWADALVDAFASPRVAAAGGRILPVWERSPDAWLEGWFTDLIALRDYGEVPRDLDSVDAPIGANMAIRRVAMPVQPFDPSLGHSGSEAMGYDEFGLFDHLSRSNRLVYEPSAVVKHHVPAARMTRDSIRRAAYHNGIGSARREKLRGTPVDRQHAATAVPMLLLRAVRQRRSNSRVPVLHRDDAEHEFSLYRSLGMHLEAATGGAITKHFINRFA